MKLRDYFVSFLAYKKAKHKSISTARQYARFVRCLEVLGHKEVSELKKNDDVLVRIEGRKHGEFGEQRAISIYRVFLSWLEDEGVTLPFKWEKVESVKTQRKDQYYLTPEEFEEFIEQIKTDTFYGLRDRMLYELLWSTGLRIGEALMIDVKDLDFEKGEIFVHTEKGGEGDKVYISDRMFRWLEAYLQKKPESEALFVNVINGDPKRMGHISVFKNLKRYKKEFGITRPLNHMAFRRGFGTNVIENRAKISEAQHLLRHKSPNTTLRSYVYYDKLKVKAVHNRIYSQAPKTPMVEVVNEMLNKKNGE